MRMSCWQRGLRSGPDGGLGVFAAVILQNATIMNMQTAGWGAVHHCTATWHLPVLARSEEQFAGRVVSPADRQAGRGSSWACHTADLQMAWLEHHQSSEKKLGTSASYWSFTAW